jgi:ferredoxin-NADP reductase
MITTQAKLLEKILSPNGQVAHLLFQTETKISFLEGQFMMIECLLRDSRIVKKPYSIATAHSIMESANLMGFYVKQEAEGGCSEYLVRDIEL